MALKKKLTKDEFEKLSDAFKSEYISDGDGYRLDIDGDEDTGALKRAKDREAQLRRDAETKLKAAQEELDRINGDDARKTGDIATLEKGWQKKLDDQKAEAEAKIAKLTGHTTKSLVDNVALDLATKLSPNHSKLLLPHIRSRLQADFEGDEPTTRILDAAGKPSAMTIDELRQEFVANTDFSGIIVASKSSGGAGGDKGRPAAGGNGDQKPFDYSKATPKELAAKLEANKTEQQES